MKRFAGRAALLAATAAACGATLLPGPVAHAQVIAAAGNTPVMATWDENQQSLDFYRANAATGLWGAPEQVTGPGTTQSFPAVAPMGNLTGIAVQGENNSLDFYQQANGGATWSRPQVVAAPGSTPGRPALAYVNHDAEIAAVGPNNVLDFYSEPVGFLVRPGHAPAFTAQQVSGPASGSPAGPYGDPSITQAGGYTVIAAQGPNISLYVFWQQIGSTTWHSSDVGQATTTPSAAQIGDSLVIAAGVSDGLFTYTRPAASLGSPSGGSSAWTPDQVISNNSEGYDTGPSITQAGNSLVIADDALWGSGDHIGVNPTTYWQPAGDDTGPWTTQQVTPPEPGNAGSGPSIAQAGQSVVIGIALPDGTGLFYSAPATGTGSWTPETVS
jgi:hypothetical protein